MQSVAKDQKEFYKTQIRSLLAVDHGISRYEIQKRLDDHGLDLDRRYVGMLYDEIIVERTKRMDRRLLNSALSSFEDTMTEVVRLAWQAANSEYINPQARVMALREIREAHNDVFQKLFNAGIFEKKLGTLDLTIRNAPLPDDRKKAIWDVFDQWGLLEAPKTQSNKPKEDEPTLNRPNHHLSHFLSRTRLVARARAPSSAFRSSTSAPTSPKGESKLLLATSSRICV